MSVSAIDGPPPFPIPSSQFPQLAVQIFQYSLIGSW